MDEIEKLNPKHGNDSVKPAEDIAFTRNYLKYLRESMTQVAVNLDPCEKAYLQTNWSEYEGMPIFRAAKRMNAYYPSGLNRANLVFGP